MRTQPRFSDAGGHGTGTEDEVRVDRVVDVHAGVAGGDHRADLVDRRLRHGRPVVDDLRQGRLDDIGVGDIADREQGQIAGHVEPEPLRGLEHAEGQGRGAGDDGGAAQIEQLLCSGDSGHGSAGRLDDRRLITSGGDVEDPGHRSAEAGDAGRRSRIAQDGQPDTFVAEVDEVSHGGVDSTGRVEVDARDPVVVTGIRDADERQPAFGEHSREHSGGSTADDDGSGDRGSAVFAAEDGLEQGLIAFGDGLDVDDGDAECEHPVRQDLRETRVRVDVACRHRGFDERNEQRSRTGSGSLPGSRA